MEYEGIQLLGGGMYLLKCLNMRGNVWDKELM